jgi:hypothetical protein
MSADVRGSPKMSFVTVTKRVTGYAEAGHRVLSFLTCHPPVKNDFGNIGGSLDSI